MYLYTAHCISRRHTKSMAYLALWWWVSRYHNEPGCRGVPEAVVHFLKAFNGFALLVSISIGSYKSMHVSHVYSTLYAHSTRTAQCYLLMTLLGFTRLLEIDEYGRSRFFFSSFWRSVITIAFDWIESPASRGMRFFSLSLSLGWNISPVIVPRERTEGFRTERRLCIVNWNEATRIIERVGGVKNSTRYYIGIFILPA